MAIKYPVGLLRGLFKTEHLPLKTGINIYTYLLESFLDIRLCTVVSFIKLIEKERLQNR
jgi:hypothetical protein